MRRSLINNRSSMSQIKDSIRIKNKKIIAAAR